MPLLASRHAALKTVCRIVVLGFVQDFDDLLLGDVREFHFALCSHAAIYVARWDESGFSGGIGSLTGGGRVRGLVAGTLEPMDL